MSIKLYEFLAKKLRPIELAYIVKKLLFIKRRDFAINQNVFFLDPVSDLGIRLLATNTYEPEIEQLILSTLKEGDTFVDLGANEGYFSVLASKKVGNAGKVFAIEPQERLWNVVIKNIQLNNCYNVQLVPYAIGEKSEEVEFILTPSVNTGSSGLVKSGRNSMWKTQASRSITLDQLLDKQKIRLLKIDIEGYEFFALKGAAGILASGQIENIILELHPPQLKQLGHSVEEIQNFIVGFGFSYSDGIYRKN
ncbi:hypothetical protein BH09BAC3_BH09BAC3_13050 [soil metagenome]